MSRLAGSGRKAAGPRLPTIATSAGRPKQRRLSNHFIALAERFHAAAKRIETP
jgi:hypothetical protein